MICCPLSIWTEETTAISTTETVVSDSNIPDYSGSAYVILNNNKPEFTENEITNKDGKIKVVANLPYYITTPIIMKLLEERLNIKSITVMVQKEVAERLAEIPGGKETGSITYSIRYYTEPEIVLEVPNTSFIPSPKVDSAVIKLEVLSTPKIHIENEAAFFKVVKAAFLQKRRS